MSSFPSGKKDSEQGRVINYKLSLIQGLVVGLPFLVLLLALERSQNGFDAWHVLLAACGLLFILAGLVLLRQFFERVSDFTSIVRKAAAGQLEVMENIARTGELSAAAQAFDQVISQLKATNEELGRKVKGLSVMREMLHLTEKSADLGTMLSRLLDHTMLLSDAQVGSVFTLDPATGRLRLVARHSPFEELPKDFVFDEDAIIMRRVIKSRQPMLVHDIETDPRICRPNNPSFDSPSFLSLPVIAGERVVGVVNLACKSRQRAFTADDEQLLGMVVAELGYALENAHLRDLCRDLSAKAQTVSRDCERLKRSLEKVQEQEQEQEQVAGASSRNNAKDKNIKAAPEHKLSPVSTLTGGVAHEFNNLLMAIGGNVSVMLMKSDSQDKDYSRLKSIEKQVKAGTELTARLLGVARRGLDAKQALDLNRHITELAQTFGQAKSKVSVRLDLDNGLYSVSVEPFQLEQALWNLMVNAADAMSQGGRIDIVTRNVARTDRPETQNTFLPEKCVSIEIRDTGPGMDPATRERAFEPFFTTKEPGKGTGLGLASVYEFVKVHQGHVDLWSEQGQGTVVTLYLPAAPPSPPVAVEGAGTVLLVEDDPSVRQVAGEMLMTMGYGVLTASNAAEALGILSANSHPIRYIMLDWNLPDRQGAKTLEQIQKIRPGIPVLVTTGLNREGLEKGFADQKNISFIQKPFSLEQLKISLGSLS
ncbi:MAG: ATP-binding protein [Desulfatibacillaceae bacterium]|nr:ATP-binding protein [Desulfatibacillaceae bacterium]